MKSSNLLFNLQGPGNLNPIDRVGKKKTGMIKKRYSSELFLQAELEEVERVHQQRNTGVARLWGHFRTSAMNPTMSSTYKELMGNDWMNGWEEKRNSYIALLKSIGRKEKRKISQPDVIWDHPSRESQSLLDKDYGSRWRTWGPYLADRQWGTVREDYSPDGNW